MDIFSGDGRFSYDPDDFPQTDFRKLVDENELEPECNLIEDSDGFLVTEIWSNPDKTITANRYYYFDPFYIDLIDERIRDEVLEFILDSYVLSERYEDAAVIRDISNLLD